MKTKKRQKQLAEKRAAKRAAMNRPGFQSRYARKKAYCDRHGVFGFEVPEPKPWK